MHGRDARPDAYRIIQEDGLWFVEGPNRRRLNGDGEWDEEKYGTSFPTRAAAIKAAQTEPINEDELMRKRRSMRRV